MNLWRSGMIKRMIEIYLPEKVLEFYYNLRVKILNTDDFKWSEYNKEYSRQISEIEKENTLILPDGKYSIVEGKILLDSSFLPLHINHKLLYETIYDLKPHSFLEVGFGCGDHLANLHKILPDIEINGCDLLEEQMNFLLHRYPELKTNSNLFVHDITVSPPDVTVDLVYTQTVIMHIRKNDRHLNALRNIFHISKKYIVLMENWGRHDFYDDILQISNEPGFPWKNVYMYVNDDGNQILMVISNTVLDGYKELYSNKELLKYL